jgi:DUF1680 family protein
VRLRVIDLMPQLTDESLEVSSLRNSEPVQPALDVVKDILGVFQYARRKQGIAATAFRFRHIHKVEADLDIRFHESHLDSIPHMGTHRMRHAQSLLFPWLHSRTFAEMLECGLPPIRRRDVLAWLGALAGTSCERRENSVPTQPRRRVADVLSPLPLDQVRLSGYLGRKVDLCIRNRILAQDAEELIEPFRHREERQCWQTEFWGKWFLSAAAARDYTGGAGVRERLAHSVHQLLATQSADGFIGNYAADSHLKSWDIWGRKYTLLGLLASGDPAALEGAKRSAAHLLTEVGSGKADIVRCGLYRGMASSSVLEPIVLLYRRTGDEQLLRFAEYIVSRWSSRQGPGLVEKSSVLVGERFPRPKKWFSWDNGEKAYEMMSCYTGLIELYRETGNATWLDAARKTWESIRDTEMNIVGSGSSQECWYGGTARQTQPAPDTMETCVTESWMQLCAQLLRITGDPQFAGEIEKTTHNALLGSMTPDGSGFAKYSALEGTRAQGPAQCGMKLNCCTANGPRGVMMLPQVAVMMGAEGPFFNLYSEGIWQLQLPSGTKCRIEVKTNYPVTGLVEIVVRPDRPEAFPLRLRVPSWSADTSIWVNGARTGVAHPGEYAALQRRWKPGDRVRVEFGVRGRVLRAGNYAAAMRGPVVLAADARLGAPSLTMPLESVTPHPGITVAFRSGLCDFASAGNTWDDRSRYRVWMPV